MAAGGGERFFEMLVMKGFKDRGNCGRGKLWKLISITLSPRVRHNTLQLILITLCKTTKYQNGLL